MTAWPSRAECARAIDTSWQFSLYWNDLEGNTLWGKVYDDCSNRIHQVTNELARLVNIRNRLEDTWLREPPGKEVE